MEFVLLYVCDPLIGKVKAYYPTGYIAVLQVYMCYRLFVLLL